MIGAVTARSEAASSRALDRAEGVLGDLRRCRIESAFDEIVGASRQHVVPMLRVSPALVELAEGREPNDLVAARVARERWGNLVATPSRGRL